MKFSAPGILALILALAVFGSLAFAGPAGSYHLLKTYKFDAAPGSTSEYFDYILVDSAARRVYVSHGTAVHVMNADTGAVVGTIAGFSKQHGVALATEFNRGFISDGNTSTVTIFDMKTLEKVGEVKTAPGTDAVNYDPMSKRVFTVNAGSSPSSTVIDPKTGQVIKTIELPGTPAQLAWDGKGMIYTNIVTKNEVAAIDTRTLEVKSLWPTAPSGNPTAIAIDREHRRLFSVGRDPQILVVMDADNGKVIQSFPVTEGTDAVAYDPETKLIFVAAREGNIHIFHEDTPDKYSVVDTVKSEYGAKTMGLDLTTHNVFVDTSDFGPAPAPTAENAHPRRPAILGTFHVLVYGR